MKVTLAQRAVPLLITTMLVAAPVWAQTAGSQTSPATTPPAATTIQTAPSGMSAPSGTSQKAAPHSSHAAMARQPGETMQSLVEHRITDLHGKLHITSQQSQPWDQFAQVMRDNAREMDGVYKQRAQKLDSMSAVDNMQSYALIEQQRAQDVQKLVPAFQTLYSSLSDQQKKTADQIFRNHAANAHERHQAAER
jgi:periplasmic protein CpxP/Spy